MGPAQLFEILLRVSFLSLGGATALPALRVDLVGPGYLSNVGLVQALTIGKIGTGPGGLYIVAVGYIMLGWIGAAVALVAVLIPPLLALPIASVLSPRRQSSRVDGLMRGLMMATSGLVIATTIDLIRTAEPAGPQLWQFALVVVGSVIGFTQGIHPIALVAVATVVGAVLG